MWQRVCKLFPWPKQPDEICWLLTVAELIELTRGPELGPVEGMSLTRPPTVPSRVTGAACQPDRTQRLILTIRSSPVINEMLEGGVVLRRLLEDLFASPIKHHLGLAPATTPTLFLVELLAKSPLAF
jgi:hypothetical protein